DFAVMWGLLWMPIVLVMFGDIDGEIEFARTWMGAHFGRICFFVLWLFPYCLRDVFGGRGLGKWIVGIRVVDAADVGSVPSIRALLLRNLTIWFSPVGMVSAYMHPDRMRFGDRLAGTMVVEDTPDPMSSPWPRRLLKTLVIVGAVTACVVLADRGRARYIRNSEIHEVGLEFLRRYEPLQEVIRPLSVEQMDVKAAGGRPTETGAEAAVVWDWKRKDLVVRAGVKMERGRQDTRAWYVTDASGHAVLNPRQKGKERVFVFTLSRD
ncbi:unnamed protein product, partial [marine sediment metagenome]